MLLPHMAVDGLDDSGAAARSLAGERIVLAGRLHGLSRREACRLIAKHGGEVVEPEDPAATLVVVGDGEPDLAAALGGREQARPLQEAVRSGVVKSAPESQFWQRLAAASEHSVRQLYTPAMLAELLSVPINAIRRWARRGSLRPVMSVHRLPYFDFQEVAVARRLAELLHAGCTLATIDRRLAELARLHPELERPLADPAVVVQGRRLYLRRGDDLAEPGGQLLLDFDLPETRRTAGDAAEPAIVSFVAHLHAGRIDAAHEEAGEGGLESLTDRLEQQALDHEAEGRWAGAIDAYRTLLMAAGPRADVHFALADVLYRSGDLGAARERFYAALELDEEYVEARTSLGCVLAETGELELAAATFEGALVHHPDFADAHYYLADVLERLGRKEEAHLHLRRFLLLAPESPWAAAARDRLGG